MFILAEGLINPVVIFVFVALIMAVFIVFFLRFFIGIPDYLERIANSLEELVEIEKEKR